jgi:hypothetical protein
MLTGQSGETSRQYVGQLPQLLDRIDRRSRLVVPLSTSFANPAKRPHTTPPPGFTVTGWGPVNP